MRRSWLGIARCHKSKWTSAIEDYFEDDMDNIENEEFSMSVMKDMLPTIAQHDERWQGFKAKKFDTKEYLCHEELYKHVETKLDQM